MLLVISFTDIYTNVQLNHLDTDFTTGLTRVDI
jgi:hypothetical protein